MINEGVRRAYLNPDNKLRASIVSDPAFARANTRDNTPAVIHTEFVPGERVEITVAAKGGGSENKSMFAMLNPSDSVADWVVGVVPEMGAGWCPPGMLGVGIGGSAEKAMLLAKKSLMAADRYRGAVGARRRARRSRNCVWKSTGASTIWAWARRGSAVSPPCSTSRFWTIRRTRRPCRWP